MNKKVNQLEELLEDQSLAEHDLELGRVFKSNLSMKDVSQLKAPNIKTTEEAILALKIGNARFFNGIRVPLIFQRLSVALKSSLRLLLLSSLAVRIVEYRQKLFTINRQATYL
jgi:hypothetical protein